MGMRARFWTECDVCRSDGIHTVGEDSMTNNERKQNDRRKGWKRLRHKGRLVDACPDCVNRTRQTSA
jgi:hypothetical protein